MLHCDDKGANFHFADCCSPLPGDDAMGFIDDNGEVVVHSLSCPRAQALKAGFGPRIVAVKWDIGRNTLPAQLRIEGIDRFGILQELIQMISTHLSIDIRGLNIQTQDEVFHCDLKVRVEDAAVVNSLCEKIRRIDGVQRAQRVS